MESTKPTGSESIDEVVFDDEPFAEERPGGFRVETSGVVSYLTTAYLTCVEDVGALTRELGSISSRLGLSEKEIFKINLPMEEAVANAWRHGLSQKPGYVSIAMYAETHGDHLDHAVLIVRDPGPGFDLDKVPDPTTAENIEIDHGRGYLLMNTLASRAKWNWRGNEVALGWGDSYGPGGFEAQAGKITDLFIGPERRSWLDEAKAWVTRTYRGLRPHQDIRS